MRILDPFAGLCDQRVAQAAARFVVVEDVVLDVDVVLCAGDFGQQGLHLRPPVGVGGDPAAVERDRVARVGQQGGQRAVLFGQAGTVGVLGFFELHGDALARPARDDALFGEVLAEEKKEKISPKTGASTSTMIHGSVFSGLRLSVMTTRMMPRMVTE